VVRSLLIRGMIAGVLAGVLAFGLARALGESQVDLAIAFEEHLQTAADEEPALVSRDVQRGVGLFVGIVVYGAAFGGLFALVFAYAYGRIGNLSPRAVAAMLAAAAFLVMVIVPDIKYPANPPSVGRPDTIGVRTSLFFTMIVISIAALLTALWIGRRLLVRLGAWNASLAAGGVFILLVAVAQISLPAVNEVPDQFPAVVVWRFRIVSIGIEAVLWAAIGLVFGALAEGVLGRAQERQWWRERT
jgi:hypothetical protein